MSNQPQPSPAAEAAQGNTVTQVTEYLYYIGESIIHLLVPGKGWMSFGVSDPSLIQLVETAFTSIENYKVFAFYQGDTVNAVQVNATSSIPRT